MDYGRTERTETPDMAASDEAGRGGVDGWPVVIRSRPLRLVELEGRIVREPSLARAIAARPSFARALAQAVLARDPSARLAWDDAAVLAGRLLRIAASAVDQPIT